MAIGETHRLIFANHVTAAPFRLILAQPVKEDHIPTATLAIQVISYIRALVGSA